jgi:ABC-type sugar transport system ATPase subunit
MATLVVDRISKSFGKNKALNDVSFECKDGEFVVIVGPSGAGKTTTLNCIAGIEFPDCGTIYLDGQDVTVLTPQERNVAMVFETYALYPQLNVFDNLAFPLRSPRHRLPDGEVRERVERTAKLLSIDVLLDRLPRQLSQGQRQRVSLGRALVRDPLVFLLDEPISHLDAKLRNAMRRELKRMRYDLSQTTLYVTHDYLEALSLADRVVVLHKGKVLQFDQTKTVYNRPAAVEVGQLFGDLPMMFLEGTIDAQMRFVADDGSFSLNTQGTLSQLSPQQKVILGLRPTDVKVASYEEGDLKGEVYSVQNQFDGKLVTIKASGHLIDVVMPVQFSVIEGDRAGVRIRPEVCFYFDRVTHRAL